MIDQTCNHKQKIGEPVKIHDHVRMDFYFFGQADDSPFRTAANGPGDMQQCPGVSTTGKDKLT